jgi:hypothetical protein
MVLEDGFSSSGIGSRDCFEEIKEGHGGKPYQEEALI